MRASELWLALAAVALGVSTFGWGFYFRWKDALHPEPTWLMAAGVGGGACSVLAAQVGYHAADAIGASASWELLSSGTLSEVAGVAITIGVVEETAKLLPVLAIVLFARRHFDEPLDGLVYAGCSAIGFSAVETVLLAWYQDLAPAELFARAVAAPLAHAMLAAPWGVGLALTVFRRKPVALPALFAFSCLVHGAYDVGVTSPGTGTLVSAGLILVLWVWAIRITPRLAGAAPTAARRSEKSEESSRS